MKRALTLLLAALFVAGCAGKPPAAPGNAATPAPAGNAATPAAPGNAATPAAPGNTAAPAPVGTTATSAPADNAAAPASGTSYTVSSVALPESAMAAAQANQGFTARALAAGPDGWLYLAFGGEIYRFRPGEAPAPFRKAPDRAGIVAGSSPGMAVDRDGNLYLATDSQVLRIDPQGNATPWAQTSYPGSLCGLPDGTLYVVDPQGIHKIGPDGVNTLVATLSGISSGPCAVDQTGNLWIPALMRLWRMAPDGTVTTVGRGVYADGWQAEAGFRRITAVAPATEGGIWIADAGNQRIRRLTADGLVYTVAGSGFTGRPEKGDSLIAVYNGGHADGPGPDSSFENPTALAEAGGRIYVAEAGSDPLRLITANSQPYPPGKAVLPIYDVGVWPGADALGQMPQRKLGVAFALYAPATAARLLLDGKQVAQSGSPFFTAVWDAGQSTEGSHQLQAEARLAGGAWAPGPVTTLQLIPNAPGMESWGFRYEFISPADGATVKGPVPVLVATDDSFNMQVEIDHQPLKTERIGMFLMATWDSTAAADGPHTLDLFLNGAAQSHSFVVANHR